jgi:hypothetical protein
VTVLEDGGTRDVAGCLTVCTFDAAKAHCPAPAFQGGEQLRNPDGFTSDGQEDPPEFYWADGGSNTGP